MEHRTDRWLVEGIVLALSLLVVLTLPAPGLADSNPLPGRPYAPIIIQGADVPEFLGAPSDELHVFSYKPGDSEFVTRQIDHITAQDGYTSTVGLPLGPMDEIVFMAEEMGLKAPTGISATLPISGTRYEIVATDPLTPTQKGWAYLVRSDRPHVSSTETYVSYHAASRQIRSERYALGFAVGHVGFDYLELFDSGVDILDRTKIRLQTLIGPVTEDQLGPKPVGVVKNGPVRVVARGGSVMGYEGIATVALEYELPQGVSAARVTTDWSSAAISSTVYNAVSPAGLVVDGQPDASLAQPVSPWWQMTGSTGTVVQVMDLSQVGGTLANYYRDNDTVNPLDPGDNRAYGESGLASNGPNPVVTLPIGWWFLDTDTPNIGGVVAHHAANQLVVDTRVRFGGPTLFLPLVIR